MKLFHVTPASSVSQILHSGIRTGKPPIWFKKGTGLFTRGFIFAFSDFREASRWAAQQSVHTDASTVIIAFNANAGDWLDDEHTENAPDCLGAWIKSERDVPPHEILEVLCQARWMVQVDENHVFLPAQVKMNGWGKFCAHLSAISQLFMMTDGESGKKS